MTANRYRRGSKVPTGTQVPLGIEYQSGSLSDRSLTDRSDTPIPTGTGAVPVPPFSTGTSTPVRGVRTSQKAGRRGFPEGGTACVSEVRQDAEVKELPAALLPLLPLPVTLQGVHSVWGRALYLCCERTVYGALVARGAVVFGVLEWEALVSAFRVGRASAASFAEWCESKARLPTYKVQLLDAFGCVLGSVPAEYQVPSVGQVLGGWGVELRSVHYGKELLP